MLTSSVDSSPPARDDLRAAIAELFSVFQRLFSQRWSATATDAKARPTWLAAFRKAGLTPTDVRRGMAAASQLRWPPSCGEFVELCQSEMPSLDEAIAEAVRWANGQVFEWSHPTIGAAALEVRSWSIKTSTERELRDKFGPIFARMIARHRQGQRLNVAPSLALPATVRTTTPAGAPMPESVKAEIDRLASLLRVSHG